MDNQNNTRLPDDSMPTVNLGPLSWVMTPLHDVLNRVRDNLTQFGKEVAAASQDSLDFLETTDLLLSERSLHDATGVLNLVEHPAAARIVAVMELCVQRFVSSPVLCTPQAVSVINQNINAVLDYLDSILKGHPTQSPGLFPAYHSMAQLAGLERIHPADLWPQPWSWLEIGSDLQPSAQVADQPQNNASFFENVLKIFKSNGTQGIATLTALTQHAWQRSTQKEERVLWQLATGYLQLLDANALFFDNYNKHLLSRIAVHYDQIMQGSGAVPEQLAQDLLFFNALGCSKQPDSTAAPVAHAIAQRYALDLTTICDYNQLLYGKVDAALREKLQQEITHFKELWSDISSGDIRKITILVNETEHLAESANAVWPDVQNFTNALLTSVRKVQLFARVPHEDMAMEVAMSILFLEKSLEDLQDSNAHFGERAAILAQRLEMVQNGQQPPPLADWMNAFYSNLNTKDSTDQVIIESRATLGEVEQALDGFFRQPQNMEQAQKAIGKLVEIASILMILDYNEASQASSAMAAQVQQLLATLISTSAIDDPASQACVLRLGANLSALSYMFEIMRYQPERARQQFYFDTQQQQLVHLTDAPQKQVKPAISHNKPVLTATAPANDNIVDTPVDGDLRDIFLEEAAEVIHDAHTAIQSLQSNMAYMPQLANLRRAFHTLKGSGRMVGLASFGEAAWEIERILNGFLADNKPATQALLQFANSALDALNEWRTAIAEQKSPRWHHRYFKQPALIMQEHGAFVPIVISDVENTASPDAQATPPLSKPAAPPPVAPVSLPDEVALFAHEPSATPASKEDTPLSFDDFSSGSPTLMLEEELPLDTRAQSALLDNLFASRPAPTSAQSLLHHVSIMPANYATSPAPEPAPEPDVFAPTMIAETDLADDNLDVPSMNNPLAGDKADSILPAAPLAFEMPQQESAKEEVALFADSATGNATVLDTHSEPVKIPDDWAVPAKDQEVMPDAAIEPALSQDRQQHTTHTPNTHEALVFAEDAAYAPDTVLFADEATDTHATEPLSDNSSTDNPVTASAQYDATPCSKTIESMLIDTSAQLSALKDMADGLPEDEIRHIGDLQLPLALFNAYLNEADTWSRQLVQELGEWALEFTQPAPESLNRLAHSLVGSSATVGMSNLASVAHGIEYALIQLKIRTAKAEEIRILLKAAEKVRQELHQFAAGIARPLDMDLLNALAAIIDNSLQGMAQSVYQAENMSATPPDDSEQKKNL